MNDSIAKEIMVKSAAGYDKVAGHFSQTRNVFWPELAFVKNHIKNGDKILDIGCGNGRFLGFLLDQEAVKLSSLSYTGIDNSKELIKIAQGKYPSTNFLVADATNLPFKNETCDVVVSFAVLHHIPSQSLREKFISEAARVLKKDGILILSVWNLWQKKYFPIILKNAAKKIFGLSDLDFKDFFLSFGPEQNARFLHAFTKMELEKIFLKSGLSIEKSSTIKTGAKQRNFLIIAKKYRQ